MPPSRGMAFLALTASLLLVPYTPDTSYLLFFSGSVIRCEALSWRRQLVLSNLQTLARLVIQATDFRHAGGACVIAEFSQLTPLFVDYRDAAQAMDPRSLVPGCGSISLLVHAIIPVAQIPQ